MRWRRSARIAFFVDSESVESVTFCNILGARKLRVCALKSPPRRYRAGGLFDERGLGGGSQNTTFYNILDTRKPTLSRDLDLENVSVRNALRHYRACRGTRHVHRCSPGTEKPAAGGPGQMDLTSRSTDEIPQRSRAQGHRPVNFPNG